MALLSLRNICLSFGGPPLFEGINLQIDKSERIGFLGRNGAGKTTLLKVIHGELSPDDGEVWRAPGLSTACLPQEVPTDLKGMVFETVAADAPAGGDERENRRKVDRVISRMELSPDKDVESLSAGLKRRVLLAKSLVHSPNLLLLDEPTNHLDIDAIRWLEDFLLQYDGSVVFVTHDRMFLRKLSTRIIDLDRARLTSWACDYDTYLKRNESALAAEAKAWAVFDKKLAREEVWIRQSIKARRTRNEGRVHALEKLRDERRSRRDRIGKVRMGFNESERSGRKVIEAKNVTFGYGEQTVIRDFSVSIQRGDKVGIIGPNGSGKTTLLRLLLGELSPLEGTVRHGTRLQTAYFDQLRDHLDENSSVQDNVMDGGRVISTHGKSKHVIGYLQDFLFSPERARSPISRLSGGERNRLLLARLFARPSNVLVLDEPTNDLDTETLALLEERLLDYMGTLLLVTHDRAFFNNVVTSTLVFEGAGQVSEYVGGYDDWLLQRRPQGPVAIKKTAAKSKKPAQRKERPRKLSYHEQRELEALPSRIDSLETELEGLHETMAAPAFYQQERAAITEFNARVESLKQELREAHQRWEMLEGRQH